MITTAGYVSNGIMNAEHAPEHASELLAAMRSPVHATSSADETTSIAADEGESMEMDQPRATHADVLQDELNSIHEVGSPQVSMSSPACAGGSKHDIPAGSIYEFSNGNLTKTEELGNTTTPLRQHTSDKAALHSSSRPSTADGHTTSNATSDFSDLDEQSRGAAHTGKRKRSDDSLDLSEAAEDDAAEVESTSRPPATTRAPRKLRCNSDPHNPDDPVNIMIYELRTEMNDSSGWPKIAARVNKKHKGSGMDGRPLGAMGCYTRFTSTAERIASARSDPYQRDWYIVPRHGHAHMQAMRDTRSRKSMDKKQRHARGLTTPTANVVVHNSSRRRNETRRSIREEDHDSAYSSYDDYTSLIDAPSCPPNPGVNRTGGVLDSREIPSGLEIIFGNHTMTPSALSTDLAKLYRSLDTHLEAAKTICDHEQFDALYDHFDDEIHGLQYSLRRVQRLLSTLPNKEYRV